MATGDAHWRAGIITVPASTGAQAITGLGGTPKAVFFFGANWSTEDTAVTSAASALFRGMGAEYLSTSTIAQHFATLSPAGDAHSASNTAAIALLDTSGGTSGIYNASLTSLDADGFTITWGGVTAGYKLVYVALMDVSNADLIGGAGNNTYTMGYKVGACLMQGTWDGWAIAGSDRTQEFFGGGAYPGSAGGSSWFGAGLTAFTFPTAPGTGQYNIGIYNQAPGTVIAQGGEFIGPFLATSDVLAIPTGTGLTNFRMDPQSTNNYAVAVTWEDEDSQTGRLTPATSTGGTVSVTGLPFAPGLVLGYSISDEPQGQASGATRGAVGFSVVTESFQWAALADGVSSRGAFQSFQRGFVDCVNGSNVHAGTIELTPDGFILTTEEDDVAPASWVWHAFGHPLVARWIPKIYRAVMIVAGAGIIGTAMPPDPHNLLLEDGFRIELEDGSGFLLL